MTDYGLYRPYSSFLNRPEIRMYRLNSADETKSSADNKKDDGKRKHHDSSVIYQSREVQAVESDSSFTLLVDVPGVKKGDLQIEVEDDVLSVYAERKSGDTVTAKYQQRFVIDDRKVNLDQVQGNLTDGVLTVSIPKKEAPKPLEVVVANTYPPEETEDCKDMRFGLDVPGVKSGDLTIQFHDGKLHIEGERKKGTSAIQIRRTLSIDDKKIDTAGLQAFLADGVLTVKAPHKEAPSTRKLMVTVTTPAAIEQAPDKEAEISVETVNEEEEGNKESDA